MCLVLCVFLCFRVTHVMCLPFVSYGSVCLDVVSRCVAILCMFRCCLSVCVGTCLLLSNPQVFDVSIFKG